MKRFSTILIVVGFSVFFVSGWWNMRRADVAERKAQRYALDLLNARAASSAMIVTLEDSLRVATRPLVQSEQPKGRASSVETTVSVSDTGSVESAPDTAQRAPLIQDSVWVSEWNFTIPKPPFAGSTIAVRAIQGHAQAALHYHIALEPVQLRFDLACVPGENGLQQAVTRLVGPSWLAIDSVSGTSSPLICNPNFAKKRRTFPRWIALPVGAAAGAVTSAIFAKSAWRGSLIGLIVGATFTVGLP